MTNLVHLESINLLINQLNNSSKHTIQDDREYVEEVTEIMNDNYPQLKIYSLVNVCDNPFIIKLAFRSVKTGKFLHRCDIDINDDYHDIFNKIKDICDKLVNRHTISDESSHNCINCGAPLKIDSYECEYCGTEYWNI